MTVYAFEAVWPRVGEGVFIHKQACVIGRVTLGDHVSIWPSVVVRGDIHDIFIGAETNVQDGVVLHVTHESDYYPGNALVIGQRVTIGHNATLHACTIEDECLIGMGAIVLDAAVLEKHIMLAAGSLVPPGKRLESGYLYKGNPAQKIRPLTDTEKNFLSYSPGSYRKLKDRFLAQGDGADLSKCHAL